jgi:hypothetical protein
MSHALHAVLVRGVPLARFLDRVAAVLREKGFAVLDDPSPGGKDVHRVVVKAPKGWCALVFESGLGLATPRESEWAASLSRALRAPALGLFVWDGEDSIILRRFEKGQ